MCATESLCPIWYGSRGATTSGFNTPRTVEILLKSKIFGPIVQAISNVSHGNLKSIWVSANVSGNHKWHKDGYKSGVNYRSLITIGGDNKIMWFWCKETDSQFGIRVPHGSLITLSKHAAGVSSLIEHRITGGENSLLIASETK